MILDDVLRNPVLKKALQAGEERMGKVVGKLLASDRVSSGLSTLVSSALQAKTTFDKGVQQALHAANLPSKDDVTALKRRLDELESMIDGLSARVERPTAGGPPPARSDGAADVQRGDAG
jgi:hypothetical protein